MGKRNKKHTIKPTDQPMVEVKPTVVNGIEDPAAAAAMAGKTVTVPAGKAPQTPKTPKTKAPKTSKIAKKAKKPSHPKAKITFRHNILPPIIGVLAFVGVLGLLNAQWVGAQYQYYMTEPTPITNLTTAADNPDPNAPARILIPDIGVDAPVVTTEKSYGAVPVQKALENGTLQYGASANPGQNGNVVIVGHSSGALWAPGNFKFVFTMLDKLDKDDRIIVDFKGKRYIYRVDEKRVVRPTEISVLQHADDPQLTLITCTPVGTSKDRLVVTARQVSPDPSTNTPVDESAKRPITTPSIPN